MGVVQQDIPLAKIPISITCTARHVQVSRAIDARHADEPFLAEPQSEDKNALSLIEKFLVWSLIRFQCVVFVKC